MSDAPKLLIVEDDEALLRQLRWKFEDYNVLTAGDRESALASARAEKPPLVTLDLGLPPDPSGASEGLATLEAILSFAPKTKVIVVTGYSGSSWTAPTSFTFWRRRTGACSA
jgi:ActR/RegA family two-component response regulator